MKVRENLSSVISSIGKNNYAPSKNIQVGRVYGVVTTEDTPTRNMFNKVGGWSGVGSVFYLDYEQSKNITGSIDDIFLDTCKIAKPLYPQYQYYPILGELVYIETLPSSANQISNLSTQKYYISTINLWNNQQQNSQPANDNAILGVTFIENPNVKNLISFEGDHIIQGRQGAALRFSSTTKLYNNINEWSSIGNEDSPITILSNGLKFNPNDLYYVEKINNDDSSIYLTSTQKIPLQVDKIEINPITNPLIPPSYFSSQTILNADRVTINSKKDEVMIFAKTNVEISTKNIVNLNADERVHLNSSKVFLGTVNNELPSEPIVLGNKLYDVLEGLLEGLQKFSTALTTVVASPEGTPMIDLKNAAEDLSNRLESIENNIESILSNRNFTA